MNCSTCSASHQLSYTCQQCYNTKQSTTSVSISQLELPQKQHQLQQKLKQINIKKLEHLKQAYKRQQKAKKIRNKIAQLKSQIVQQQAREEKLMQISKLYQQNLVIEELDFHEKYIIGLKERNKGILDKVNNQKKRNKYFVEVMMKIFGSEQRRYKVMKYFRLQQNQNVIFTLQQSNLGIPVLKVTNEQTIKYQPIQNKTYIQKEDEKNLTQTLKISHKLLTLVHKYFLYHIKLPYKMFFHRQFCFLANTFIKFDNELIDLTSPQLVDFVNMLQANLQFVAYAVGVKEKPFVILNKLFLDEFQKWGFCKNRQSNSRWASFLKYLKPAEIMNHYEEQEHASQVIVVGMEKDSDQQFEILE